MDTKTGYITVTVSTLKKYLDAKVAAYDTIYAAEKAEYDVEFAEYATAVLHHEAKLGVVFDLLYQDFKQREVNPFRRVSKPRKDPVLNRWITADKRQYPPLKDLIESFLDGVNMEVNIYDHESEMSIRFYDKLYPPREPFNQAEHYRDARENLAHNGTVEISLDEADDLSIDLTDRKVHYR